MTTDEYLARELMGFHVSILPNPWGGTNAAGAYEKDGVIEYWKVEDWHPTTSIEQALGDGGPGTVVGKMRERGWYLSLRQEADKEWAAYFWKLDSYGIKKAMHGVFSKVPAEAISTAARKALEGEGR